MTNELAIPESTITPAMFDQAIEDASLKAKTLARIVEAQHLYTKMGQGKHIHVEAWITIGKGYGLTAAVLPDAEILYNPEGGETGAKAQAVIYDASGMVVGGAPGFCMRSGNWQSKPIEQLISMAGTRAVSKAFRLLLSYVVVLAGYSPTPYEEMDNDRVVNAAPARTPRKPAKKADAPAFTEVDLRAWVKEQKMEWDDFITGLDFNKGPDGESMAWEQVTGLGMTPAGAKQRWEKIHEDTITV
jgi:hypothetical protein